jgi:hypothetical protein
MLYVLYYKILTAMPYIPVDSATQCRHPEYQSYESRLSTFTRWPSHLSQRPEDLADAGLFYIGKIFLFLICFMSVYETLE